jgi:rare lipoprotein A (peptidoglycan hydrolase)
MKINIIRVNENTVIQQVEIPYETQYVYDNNLPESTEVVLQPGITGQKEQVVNVVYQNGWVSDQIVIHERILSNPQNAVTKKGTRQAYSGMATWYGPGFEGGRTASGEPFLPNVLAAAHRTLPFGTLVRVTNTQTGLSCVVKINDRGPYSYHVIDLTRAAADAIGMASVAPVILEVL